jgi:D-glycero-D-manno-heptose 1,7-bisphosphate phosphatase
MQVVILAGGLGTRLDPNGTGVPKALREVDGLTILEWQIRSIGKPKSKVLLLIGEESNRNHFQEIVPILVNRYNHEILVIVEEKRMGTLGALIATKSTLENEFVILLGDILLDFPIEKCLSRLKERKLDFLAVSRLTEHPEDSDVFEIDERGIIKKFSHYPHSHGLSDNIHLGLTGVYACKRKFLDKFPSHKFIDIWESLQVNYEKQKSIGVYYSYNNFKDVGTTKRLSEAPLFAKKLNFKESSVLYIIDRDDTLISDPSTTPSRRFLPNLSFIQELNAIKWKNPDSKFCIITNQPAIAKNQISVEVVRAENDLLIDFLESKSLTIDALEYCPHHPESGFRGEIKQLKIKCFCRKPLPGMAIKIIRDLDIRPKRIVVYGDSTFDFFLARNLGAEFRWIFMRKKTKKSRSLALYSFVTGLRRDVGSIYALHFLFSNLIESIAKWRWTRIDRL